jgi:hypothetical protein
MALQHLRSSTADKRPTPAAMSDGQLALNTNLVSPGLFFKDSNGDSVKIGPVHVGTTAPNVTPGAGGQAGNSKGEQWLDTSSSRYVFKIWDGTAWRSEDGEFVNVSGDTMTGLLVAAGNINVGANTGAAAIEIGLGATANRNAYIDFVTDTTYTDYGLRLIRGDTGANSVSQLEQRGTGELRLATLDAAPLTFFTNNAERLHITSAGLVGIGTSSPGQALDVKGNVRSSIGTGTGTGGAGYALYQFGTSATAAENWHIGSEGDGSFRFYNQVIGAGVERLRITSAGLVGIGTSSPGARLHVGSNASSGNWSGFFGDNLNGAVAPPAAYGLAFGYNRSGGSGEANIAYGTGTGAGLGLIFGSYDGTTYTNRVIFDGAGNVGIGTASPGNTLDISPGSAGEALRIRGGTGGTSIVQFTDNAASAQWGTITTTSASADLTHSSVVRFLTASSERARIDSSGRLLVGTSSDSGGALFQVNGDRIRVGTAKTPATSGATGATGEIAWDADYIYVCTATNTWKRSAIATW